MDTYRKVCYNINIVEKVNLSGVHRHTITPEGRVYMADTEKKVSEAQRKATDKYLEKFDEMRVRVPKGQKDIVKAHAETQGESLNAFINRAITETIDRDNTEGKARDA